MVIFFVEAGKKRVSTVGPKAIYKMATPINNHSSASEDSDPEADDSDTGMPMLGESAYWKPKEPKNSKKRSRDDDANEASADDEDEQVSSEDSDDDSDDDGILTVNFEFDAIQEKDYHGMKGLLEKGAWNQVNTSDVADALVKQINVGSTLKIDDGSEVVYGIISTLNVGVLKSPSVNAMCTFLQRACKDTTTSTLLSSILQPKQLASEPLGLVVSERYVNMPADVAPALYQLLLNDLKEAKSDQYKHVLMVSKCYVEEAKANKKKKKGKKRRKKNSTSSSSSSSSSDNTDQPMAYFIKFEDEIFRQHATASFTFPAAKVSATSESSNEGFGTESYMVMLLDMKVLPECVGIMKSMVEAALAAEKQ